jgi:hypothetical protein
VCNAFECNSVIITLSSSFQTLLKKAEAARTGGADAGDESRPKGAVDAEVARIVSEAVTDPDGPASGELEV